jgi:hypothetical protein
VEVPFARSGLQLKKLPSVITRDNGEGQTHDLTEVRHLTQPRIARPLATIR